MDNEIFSVNTTQIKLNITDNNKIEIYEDVEEHNINIKPIKSFYDFINKNLF